MIFSELLKCLKDLFIGFPTRKDHFAAAGVLLLGCVLFQKFADSSNHKKAEDEFAQHQKNDQHGQHPFRHVLHFLMLFLR